MAPTSSISEIPRVSKGSHPPGHGDLTARKQSIPPPIQRAPTPRAPSAPPITVKSEPEPPTLANRLEPIRAAKEALSQSTVIPLPNFSAPPPQDPRRSLPHRPSWGSILSPSSAIFPPSQRPMDALLVHNGISPSDAGPGPSNPPYSNSNGQYGSPHPSEPTFRQDPRNPLHGNLRPNGMEGAHKPQQQPPLGPRGMPPNGHAPFSPNAPFQHGPPPTSASSTTSSQYDHPPPTATSASGSSKSSWWTDTYERDRDHDRDRGRSSHRSRSPPASHLPLRPEPMALGHRRDSGGYASSSSRFSPPRDPRNRNSVYRYGAGAGRGRGGAVPSQRDRDPPISPTDRDQGWRGRSRGSEYAPR